MMMLFAMDWHQYQLCCKALNSYIHDLESMYKRMPPPKNPYHVKREQNVLNDIKVLQDLLLQLKAREGIW